MTSIFRPKISKNHYGPLIGLQAANLRKQMPPSDT